MNETGTVNSMDKLFGPLILRLLDYLSIEMNEISLMFCSVSKTDADRVYISQTIKHCTVYLNVRNIEYEVATLCCRKMYFYLRVYFESLITNYAPVRMLRSEEGFPSAENAFKLHLYGLVSSDVELK